MNRGICILKKRPSHETYMRVCLVCERERVEACVRERPVFLKRDLHIYKRDLYIEQKRPIYI